MKRLALLLLAGLPLLVYGQKKPPAKPAMQGPLLRSAKDSASYAIGVSIASFYNEQGLKGLNAALIAKGVNDVQSRKGLLLNEYQANTVLMDHMNRLQEAKAAPHIKGGKAFLEENSKKQGVITTPSGLQYQVLQEGNGPRPTATDTVIVHYVGTLLSGEEFDNSYSRGEPLTVPVSGVIKGWTEALQLMRPGARYRLVIPHHLAYGIYDSGTIPGGALLLFEVELLGIKGR